MSIIKKVKKAVSKARAKVCEHELDNPVVIRSTAFIIERGYCVKCGEYGEYETRNVNGTEKRTWRKLDAKDFTEEG